MLFIILHLWLYKYVVDIFQLISIKSKCSSLKEKLLSSMFNFLKKGFFFISFFFPPLHSRLYFSCYSLFDTLCKNLNISLYFNLNWSSFVCGKRSSKASQFISPRILLSFKSLTRKGGNEELRARVALGILFRSQDFWNILNVFTPYDLDAWLSGVYVSTHKPQAIHLNKTVSCTVVLLHTSNSDSFL